MRRRAPSTSDLTTRLDAGQKARLKYARVSTEQQDLTTQRDGLHALGVDGYGAAEGWPVWPQPDPRREERRVISTTVFAAALPMCLLASGHHSATIRRLPSVREFAGVRRSPQHLSICSRATDVLLRPRRPRRLPQPPQGCGVSSTFHEYRLT